MPLGAGFIGTRFSAARKQAAAHLLKSLCPLEASLTLSAAEVTQPIFQAPSNGGKRQGERRDPLGQRRAKLRGANEIIGEQARQPFFARQVRGLDLQLRQVHLSFQVAQVQFDVPAQPIKSRQLLERVVGGVGQGGKKAEQLGAKALALELHDQQAALQRVCAAIRLELVLAGGFPMDLMIAGPESLSQQFARATLGQAQQNLLARLAGGLSAAEDPEITVADEQALGEAIQNDPAGQDLLADMDRAQGAVQGGSAQGAEANDHAHQAPIRAPVLIAIGGKLLGQASVGAHPHGAAIQQGQHPAAPERGGTQAGDFAALQQQGLGQKLPRQPLAGIAVRGRRVGNQLAGELFVDPVGSAAARVAQSRVQAVVRVEALKEQIPERDQRAKEAVVEALGLESRQLAQGAVRQQLDKEEQQLGRGEGGLGGRGFWVQGVFLEGMWYA